MLRHSSVNGAGIETATTLKAPLKSALGSLSITLDEELTRYRRQRQGHPMPPARRLKVKTQKPLNLITVKPDPSRQPATASPSISGAVSIPPPPPQPIPESEAANAIAESALTKSAQVPVIAALATRHDLSPEGYLASSEALLQSLATDEIPTDADSALEPTADTWIDSWSTPLGLGALMLLLVSSAGIGYALTNPAAVSHIPLINGWSEASENEKTVSADSSTAATSDSAFYSFGPNLSSQEFVELNLSSLSTLHASQSAPLNPSATSTATTSAPVTTRTPAAAATPAPVATTPLPAAPLATARPAEPTAPAAPAAPAASRPASPAPARTALPPAASPSAPPARPVPAAAAPPTSRQSPPPAANYYVVTDYTGDQSLSEARTAVGDAYVRNFSEGARIQMGAFNSAEAAESLVEDLQSQGISANVRAD